MKLSERDKRVLVIGGLLAVVVVLVFHVLLPMAKRWGELGDRLEPKREEVANLRERVKEHGRLIERREVLVRRMGSLLDPVPAEEEKKDKPDAPKKGPENAEPKSDDGEKASEPKKKEGEEAEKGSAGGDEVKGGKEEAAKAADENEEAGPDSVCLSAHVERVAKAAGVKVQRLVPKKYSGRRVSGGYFKPVLVEVSVESDITKLLKLLQGLEKGARFARVDQVKIHRDVKQPTIKTTIDVLAYESMGK